MNKLLIYLVIAVVIVGGVWYFGFRSEPGEYMTPTPSAEVRVSPTSSVHPGVSPTKTPSPRPSGTLIINESKIFRVTIQGFAFSPSSVTVKRGDVVVFKNADTPTHTVTSATGAFESGSLSTGSQWTLTTATLAPGTYAYHCSIHPSMQGTIIVQ